MLSLRYRRFESSGKHFEVNRLWEWQQQRRFAALVAKLQADRQHDTCIVVGNGPSINLTDLSQLSQADVLISNFAFEHAELFKQAKLLGIVNHLVAEQASEVLSVALNGSIPLLAPSHLRYALPPEIGAYFLPMATTPEFQLTPRYGVSCQSTVTYFLLQVAYWLGYQRVLLIGVDNHYVQPDVREGQVLQQNGADLNHFSTTYFQGKKWHAADVDRMASTYELARAAYAAGGRSIVDCSVGGQLRVFPKADLADALADTSKAARSMSLAVGASKPKQARELLEHLGIPILAFAVVLMLVVAVTHTLSGSLISQATLTLCVAALVILVAFGCIGVVSAQVRRMQVRMQFELGVLRAFVNREKNI